MSTISESLTARIERLLNSKTVTITLAKDKHTPAIRMVWQSHRGRYFVKVGATPQTAHCLNREIQIYRTLHGPFMPALVAAEECETEPILIIEDMSSFHWPPPWDCAKVDLALRHIEIMHNTKCITDKFADVHGPNLPSWQTVASDPAPFLSLGVADESWLKDSLPILLHAETGCSTIGTSLCHYDLRSDNMCFTSQRSVFIDWNQACLSNPKLDLAFWLPSLAYEGGPIPQDILPDSPETAARVSGYLASRAGLPDIVNAPHVRMIQRQQLNTALSWVIFALDLKPVERQI